MFGVALSVECGNNGTVLVRYRYHGCRDLGVAAGKVALGGKYVAQFGRYMIIYGGVDGKRHVLTLIHQRGKYKVGQCEQRSALADVTCVHMVLCYGHGCLGQTGFNISKLNTYEFGELITIVQKILKCHD